MLWSASLLLTAPLMPDQERCTSIRCCRWAIVNSAFPASHNQLLSSEVCKQSCKSVKEAQFSDASVILRIVCHDGGKRDSCRQLLVVGVDCSPYNTLQQSCAASVEIRLSAACFRAQRYQSRHLQNHLQ